MKKFLILSVAVLLSSCSHQTTQEAYSGNDEQGCDYYNGETCVRYKNSARPRQSMYKKAPMALVAAQEVVYVEKQEPVKEVVYVERVAPTIVSVPTAASVATTQTVTTGEAPCDPIVKEVREPVEIIYKRTKQTTIYEPKTTTEVSYEKEAYKGDTIVQPTTPEVPCCDEVK